MFKINLIKQFFVFVIFSALYFCGFAQGVAINLSGNEAHESSILDVESINSGFLLPRMSATQRDAIVEPAHSLLIYNTSTNCFEAYNSNTSEWVKISCIGSEDPCDSSLPSEEPSGISGNNTICEGHNTNLSVQGGGLGTDAEWVWYKDACGGTALNFGPSITVSPNINTTYYIRAESPCDITNCKSILISVIPLPNTPVVNSASNIGETSFNANWQTVGSASSYILQVSKYNTFSSFVLNTNVGNLTSYNINGLECETTYYYRVKAVNSCGESSFSNIINLNTSNCPFVPTPCPGTPTVTYNGYTYTTVQIKTQCWMVENLRTTKYRDGTSLNSTWGQGTDGRYTNACSGGDGLFYNFYAANDTKKLCPTGWRTPTSTDFQTLMNNTPDASSIMVIGTNSYAWAGYLGGYKTSGGTCYDADKIGFYWTTSLASGNPIDFRLTKSTTNILSYNINNYGTSDKYRGQYVRCIKE